MKWKVAFHYEDGGLTIHRRQTWDQVIELIGTQDNPRIRRITIFSEAV